MAWRFAFITLAILVAIFQIGCGSKQAASAVFSDKAAAALADAAAAGDSAQVAALIKDGADPNAIGDNGTSLLQWAMLNGSKAGVESLLAAGADTRHADADGATAMQYAAMFEDPEYLDILLAHRVDLNTPNSVNGRTPLMYALITGRDVQFHKLLKAGAEINRYDLGGDTALHLAAETNDFSMALDLLKSGANPAALNSQGVTFQRYLYMTPANIMTRDALSERDALENWMNEHNIPLDAHQSQ